MNKNTENRHNKKIAILLEIKTDVKPFQEREVISQYIVDNEEGRIKMETTNLRGSVESLSFLLCLFYIQNSKEKRWLPWRSECHQRCEKSPIWLGLYC